ncbi:MAPEG family protein [Palleronia sp. KMU-117]|uniref:MAPEG family protein n=1 Tax=Palleronia sp. KMU-117 TaxID=3434108 RepID=UPI003D762E32
MTPELTVLAFAFLLQVVQIGLYSHVARAQVGTRTALLPRDEPVVLSGLAGRAQRAMNNHFEGLLLFAVAVTVVTLSGKASGTTAAMAWIYLAARIAYVPAYLYGWVPWRSLVWTAGFLATTAMVIAALL